jgi:hypothetical protein
MEAKRVENAATAALSTRSERMTPRSLWMVTKKTLPDGQAHPLCVVHLVGRDTPSPSFDELGNNGGCEHACGQQRAASHN